MTTALAVFTSVSRHPTVAGTIILASSLLAFGLRLFDGAPKFLALNLLYLVYDCRHDEPVHPTSSTMK